jgi:hypothetical protein
MWLNEPRASRFSVLVAQPYSLAQPLFHAGAKPNEHCASRFSVLFAHFAQAPPVS